MSSLDCCKKKERCIQFKIHLKTVDVKEDNLLNVDAIGVKAKDVGNLFLFWLRGEERRMGEGANIGMKKI